jgi:hypothetical protein
MERHNSALGCHTQTRSGRTWPRELTELIERDIIVTICAQPRFKWIAVWRSGDDDRRATRHRPGHEFDAAEVPFAPHPAASTANIPELLERKHNAVD